jgi:hypothetical protein
MTSKKRVLRMLRRFADGVSIERILYHLGVMRRIEIGLAQSDRGEGTEHEAFTKKLAQERGRVEILTLDLERDYFGLPRSTRRLESE